MTTFTQIFKQDTFTRANQSGWGTASGGGTWTTATGTPTLSIASNEGKATAVSANDWIATFGTNITDTEVLVRCTISDFSNDAVGIYVRYIDANNFYRCFLSGGSLSISKKVGGTFTGSIGTTSASPVNNTFYWIRFRILGTSLQAKFWSGTLGSEPGSFQITITDSGLTAAGKVGVGAFHNVTGDSSQFDNFTSYYPQNNKTIPVRIRARTQSTRSIVMRIVTANPSNVRTQSLPIRSKIQSQVTKSVVLRGLVRTLNNQSLPIRILAFGSSLNSIKVRAVITTQVNKSVAIRAVVRSAGNTYSVNIAGEDVFVQATSLSIDTTIGKRSTASFTVISDTMTHFYQYQQVWIYDPSGTLVFSGYITQPQERKPGSSDTLVHTITCTDQHYLADKRVVAASYVNKTCGYIVQDIVQNVLAQEGVSIGQIFDGLTPSPQLYPSPTLYPSGSVGLIPSVLFAYCSVAQALDALVTAASSAGIPFYWMIDQEKRLYFVPYTTMINNTVVDGSLMEEKVSNPTFSRQNPTYRNTQYITGGTAETLTQTETRVGDGNTQAWAMGFGFAQVPTVTVNTVAKTVGIKGVDTGKDFYWSKGDPVLVQDNGAVKLISTNTLKVVYIGQYPTINIAQDSGQVQYQRSVDGTSGIVEAVQQDSTLTSIGNGLSEAGQLLTRYAQQGSQLQFVTRDPSFVQGQFRTFNLPHFALNNTQMLISDVSASDQVDGINIYYAVKAVQGPYDVTWQDFFSTLLKQQTPVNAINVGVSQTLTILASVSVSASPSTSVTLTTIPSFLPGPNVYPSSTRYPG